jgi:bifunctional DNA-binding transcriptional regulator/antitoxin component of YhaV-PrlF toxin-antitoxin module
MRLVQRFDATLPAGEDARPVVEVPFDVKERFGKARAPVRVRVNGTELRTTVAVYGSRYYVGFNKEVRERAGIGPGDSLTVEIELDEGPREVDVPPALERALAAEPEARAAFDRLSYTHRREYAEWIAEAKRDETRERRLAKAIEMLRGGVKHP